jgi:hypothetical protein
MPQIAPRFRSFAGREGREVVACAAMSFTGKSPRRRLGDLLVEEGLVTREQLQEALEYQKLWGHRLGTALVAKQFLTELELIDVLGRELRLQTCDPLDVATPKEVLDLVPKQLAAQHDLIPVAIEEGGGLRTLVIAMSDPMNYDAISQVRTVSRMEVQPVIGTMRSVARAIHQRYGVMSAASKLSAFADSEMVIVHKGGGEVKIDRSGLREEVLPASRPPAPDPFAPDAPGPAKLSYPPAVNPGWNQANPPTFLPPAPAFPPPYYPPAGFAPYPLAAPPYPGPPPLAPTYPTLSGYPPTPLPMPPSPAVTPLPKAPGTVSLAVMEEVSKHSPKDLMLSIVRLLLRKGLLNGDELLAELRRRG